MVWKYLTAVLAVALLVSSCGSPLGSSSSSRPSGTYVATLLGIEQTATFKGDTLEIYDRIDGKRVFKYVISPDGTEITTTNVATRETGTDDFEFIREQGIVVIGGITYYRK